MHPYPVVRSRFVKPRAYPASTLADTIMPWACTSDNHVAGSALRADAYHNDALAYTWYLAEGNIDINPRSIGVTSLDVRGDVVQKFIENSGDGPVLSAEFTLVPGACASVGGCVNAKIELAKKIDMPPRGSLKVYMDSNPVFLGRAVEEPKVNRSLIEGTATESFVYNLEGWKVYASEMHLFGKVYERTKLSDVVKDVAREFGIWTPVSYDPLNITEEPYVLDWQEFDGVTVASALDSLTQLAGDYVWGVDTNGVLFWAKRNLEPPYKRNLWLGHSRVDITSLKSNFANMVNALIVESPVLQESDGRPSRIKVDDPESIELYGRVEEIVQYPFALTQAEVADIQAFATSKAYVTAEDDKGQPLYEMQGAAIDDYLSYELSKPVTSFVFNQPSYDGTGSVETLEIYDDANELLQVIENAKRLVPIYFAEEQQSFRIVAKSAPKEGNWTWAPYDASIGEMIDCVRYGYQVLELRNSPVTTGKLLEEHERFVNPEFAVRVTDNAGQTTVYEVESTTYTVRNGLESVSNIGRGGVNMARAVAMQERAQRLAEVRGKEADRQLSAEIKKVQSTPYAIRLDGLEDGEPTYPAPAEEIWSFTLNRTVDIFPVSITSIDPADKLARLPVLQNGTEVGVITFNANANVGSLFFNLGRRFNAGDTFSVLAPDPQDVSLWGFVFHLRGDWVA